MHGRRITALVAAGLLALVAAGCGGDDSLAPQVPGGPAEVQVPQSAQSPADASAQGQTADSDATTDGDDPTTDTESSDGTDTGTTETPAAPSDSGTDQGGGAAAPEAPADGPTNDTPPPDGSNAEQFEDFCAQNPGAC